MSQSKQPDPSESMPLKLLKRWDGPSMEHQEVPQEYQEEPHGSSGS